jgi:predicted GH43/DUF377 family glycosyl hydrolase
VITRRDSVCLLEPRDVPPTRDDLEVVGVFNPGAIATGNGDEVVLLARIAERPKEARPGFFPLIHWDWDRGEIVVDWVSDREWEQPEPRIIRRRRDGLWRLTFTSHLRVIRSPDGRSISSIDGPRLVPQMPLESFGLEDARITRINDTFCITYVAASDHGPATALATTRDFETFQRHGIVFCPENKDVVIFPERFNGEYAALHRPTPHAPFNMPEMWLAWSDDMVHWGRHRHFLAGGGSWDDGRIGGGTPPIRTDAGWLEIYHGKQQDPDVGVVGAYAAGALLLDPDDPSRIIARTARPILQPEETHEREGFVPNVVFPTGIVPRGDALLIYCGAADTAIGLVELSWEELRGALLHGELAAAC